MPLLVLAVVVGLSILAPIVLRNGSDHASGWDLFLLAIAVVTQSGFVVTIRALVPEVPAELPVLRPLPAINRHRFSSPSSRRETAIRFVNRTQQSLGLHWIDFDGALVSYGTIAPQHEDRVQGTFLGHWFLLTEPDGREAVMFEAQAEPALAVVDDAWLQPAGA